MRFYRIMRIGIILAVFSISISLAPLYGQDKPERQENILSLTGRLALESREKEPDRLLLYGMDRKIYIIHGDFRGILESLLSDLGESNLLSVRGILWEGYDVSCRTKYGFSEQGEKTLDTQCLRYYHFNVTRIDEAKKSEEEIPPPERDAIEEARVRQTALARIHQESLAGIVIRNIEGKINSLNLRAPIKTIKISFRDKHNRPVNKVLLLTSETRIAKKALDAKEPLFLGLNSLRVGQEVYIEYSEDEYKPEALFITITKE